MNYNKICGNCNTRGHIYKNCTGPITSIGIIAFRKSNKDKLEPPFIEYLNNEIISKNRQNDMKILLVQRKDTMGFIDFVRGKYPSSNSDYYLNIFLSEMIPSEINSLLTKDFDTIWDELWVDHTSKYYKNDKREAKEKYLRLDIQKLVNSAPPTIWAFQEFGLPKGRRNLRENFKDCAIREFQEETGYTSDDYNLLDEIGYIEESFTGSNDINYKHIYYLAKLSNNAPVATINPSNKYQLNEIKNIGWFTLEESMSLIRSYDKEKKRIISKAFKAFDLYNNSYISHRNIKNYLSNSSL